MTKLKYIFFQILILFGLRKKYKPLPGSTIISIKGAVTDEMREKVTEVMTANEQAVQKFLCSYIVPDSKAVALAEFVANLRKKYPDMKNDRVFRKAAEYFKFEKLKFL